MGEFLPLIWRESVKFGVDCSLQRRTTYSLKEFWAPDELLHHSIAFLFALQILFMPSHVTCLNKFDERVWILGLIRGTSPPTEQENGSNLRSQSQDNQHVESGHIVTSKHSRTDHHAQQNEPNSTPILIGTICFAIVFLLVQISFIAILHLVYNLARTLLKRYFWIDEQLSLIRVVLNIPLVGTSVSKFQIMILHYLCLIFWSVEKHYTDLFGAAKYQIRIVSIKEDDFLTSFRIGSAI